jgi:hypothetical protein
MTFLRTAVLSIGMMSLVACGGSSDSGSTTNTANPCGGEENPCEANPCGGEENPCEAANPCEGENPCGETEEANPCGGDDMNPCG